MNDLVPSIGSRIQRKPLVPGRSENSSPRMPSWGKRRGDPLRSFFGPAIGGGDRRVVALQFDVRSSRRKYSSVMRPASSANSTARGKSRRRSAEHNMKIPISRGVRGQPTANSGRLAIGSKCDSLTAFNSHRTTRSHRARRGCPSRRGNLREAPCSRVGREPRGHRPPRSRPTAKYPRVCVPRYSRHRRRGSRLKYRLSPDFAESATGIAPASCLPTSQSAARNRHAGRLRSELIAELLARHTLPCVITS